MLLARVVLCCTWEVAAKFQRASEQDVIPPATKRR